MTWNGREPQEPNVRPLDADCTTCRTRAGLYCRTRTGVRLPGFHVARIEAAGGTPGDYL